MKVLLDTNFIRNLEKTKRLDLLSLASIGLSWDLYLPSIVKNELEQKSLPNEIQSLLDSNQITIISCEENCFKKIKITFFGLDDGELDAICIVDKCEDRTFKDYLIMTDDGLAQSKAASLGMSTLSILIFFFIMNQKGILPKNDMLKSMNLLEKNGFVIGQDIKNDIVARIK